MLRNSCSRYFAQKSWILLVKIILVKNCVLSAFMIFFSISRLQNSSSRPILWVECAFWSLCWRNGQLYRNFLWKPREFQRMLGKYLLQRCRCTCKGKGNIHGMKWFRIHSYIFVSWNCFYIHFLFIWVFIYRRLKCKDLAQSYMGWLGIVVQSLLLPRINL